MVTAGSARRTAAAAAQSWLEPQVRRVVAETLGVEAGDLGPDVSLIDDLAADSLDLVEVGVALESELQVSLPEASLEGVRTYGDLLAAVRDAFRVDGRGTMPVTFRAGVVGPGGGARLARAGLLTPYDGELLAADARRLGRGARLELEVAGDAPTSVLAEVARRFAELAARGVDVRVRQRGR